MLIERDTDYLRMLLVQMDYGWKNSYKFKQDEWKNFVPFEKAEIIGKEFISRIINNNPTLKMISLRDREKIEYLSSWSNSSYLGLQVMGATKDIGRYQKRRHIIFSLVKSMEDEWISKNNSDEDLNNWKTFYSKVYTFFDNEIDQNNKMNQEVSWLRAYFLYYTCAWNSGMNIDNESVKYRGFLAFICSLNNNQRFKILDQFKKLDKSTGMSQYPLVVSKIRKVMLDRLTMDVPK